MISAANIDPNSVVMVPKLAKKNVKPVDPSKVFCFPRQLIVRPKKAA